MLKAYRYGSPPLTSLVEIHGSTKNRATQPFLFNYNFLVLRLFLLRITFVFLWYGEVCIQSAYVEITSQRI